MQIAKYFTFSYDHELFSPIVFGWPYKVKWFKTMTQQYAEQQHFGFFTVYLMVTLCLSHGDVIYDLLFNLWLSYLLNGAAALRLWYEISPRNFHLNADAVSNKLWTEDCRHCQNVEEKNIEEKRQKRLYVQPA